MIINEAIKRSTILPTEHKVKLIRENSLFGSLRSGITNKIIQVEWQKLTEAVNTISSARTQEVIKHITVLNDLLIGQYIII